MQNDGGVLVVAFGTRGDVLPLLHVARALSTSNARVRFATHEVHASLFDWLGIELIPVPTDPMRPAANAWTEYAPVVASCECSVPRVIVFNLFSLGAWYIARKFAVPTVAISPCLIPYQHPPSFITLLRRLQPGLRRRLLDADGRAGCLGWVEISHWLWPLWSGRWDELRAALQLPAEVLLAEEDLPPPPPLLYAFSSLLIPPPSYWPPSVRVVGCILDPAADGGGGEDGEHGHSSGSDIMIGSESLEAILTDRPLYIGFGSCSELILQTPESLTPRDSTGSPRGGSQPSLQCGRREDGITSACDDDAGEECEQRGEWGQRSIGARVLSAAAGLARLTGRPILLHACGCEALRSLWEQQLQQLQQREREAEEEEEEVEEEVEVEEVEEEVVAEVKETAEQEVEQVKAKVKARVKAKVEVEGEEVKGGPQRALLSSSCRPRFSLVAGELPLGRVFKRCCAALHHGGSGTVAAAVAASLPQLIHPLIFDQPRRDPLAEIPSPRSHRPDPIVEIPSPRSHRRDPIAQIPSPRSRSSPSQRPDPIAEIP